MRTGSSGVELVLSQCDGLSLQPTAYENLEFYARVYGLKSIVGRDKRIREALELVGLYETRNGGLDASLYK